MPATAKELEWARTIKDAAVSTGVTGVTDFEYLQHGIVSKGNITKSLKRIGRLAAFRKEYSICGPAEDDPRALLASLMELYPGFMPGIGQDAEGHGVLTSVYRLFHPSKLTGAKQWRGLMVSFYYILNALNAEPENMRAGMVMACDCKDIGWGNFSLEAEKRAADLYQDAYAVRFKSMIMVDAPFIMNSMIAIVKVFLSKKIRDVIVTETSDVFLASKKVPQSLLPAHYNGSATDEGALEWFEERLAVRIANENNFKL